MYADHPWNLADWLEPFVAKKLDLAVSFTWLAMVGVVDTEILHYNDKKVVRLYCPYFHLSCSALSSGMANSGFLPFDYCLVHYHDCIN